MKVLPEKVIFDEVQRVPGIFEYIKMEIDCDRRPGRFLMTGSAQFSMVKGIAESLAGRCGNMVLLPFQSAEVPDIAWSALELDGSYPELVVRGHNGSADWYDAYIENYIERDLRSMLDIGKLDDFRTVLGLLAARTAQELNLSSIAREAGVTERTVAAWVSVLEASYLIFLLPAWHRNLGKRLVKRPKIHFWDTGLACRLTGIQSVEQLEKGPLAGSMFENFIVAELAKDIAHRGLDRRLFHFRSNSGLESDFVVEDIPASRVTFGEVKRRMTIRPDDFRTLKTLIADAREFSDGINHHEGVVVSTGSSIENPAPGLSIVGAGMPGGFRLA